MKSKNIFVKDRFIASIGVEDEKGMLVYRLLQEYKNRLLKTVPHMRNSWLPLYLTELENFRNEGLITEREKNIYVNIMYKISEVIAEMKI